MSSTYPIIDSRFFSRKGSFESYQRERGISGQESSNAKGGGGEEHLELLKDIVSDLGPKLVDEGGGQEGGVNHDGDLLKNVTLREVCSLDATSGNGFSGAQRCQSESREVTSQW